MTTDPFERAAIREQRARENAWSGKRWKGMAIRGLLPPLIVWGPLMAWHWFAASPATGLSLVLLIVHAAVFGSFAVLLFLAFWGWVLERGLR